MTRAVFLGVVAILAALWTVVEFFLWFAPAIGWRFFIAFVVAAVSTALWMASLPDQGMDVAGTPGGFK